MKMEVDVRESLVQAYQGMYNGSLLDGRLSHKK
jgi:hypothetical protein